MKKLILVLLAVAMLVCAVACNSDGTPAGMQDVALESASFHLYVSEFWISTASSGISGAKATTSPTAPNVTATVYYPSEQMDVAAYWQNKCMPDYSANLKGLEVQEQGTATTLGGKDAQIFVFKFAMGQDMYRCKQVMTVYEHQIYTVTYTALEKDYDSCTADVDEILANFTFK